MTKTKTNQNPKVPPLNSLNTTLRKEFLEYDLMSGVHIQTIVDITNNIINLCHPTSYGTHQQYPRLRSSREVFLWPDIFFIVVITTFKKGCLDVFKLCMLQCLLSSTERPTPFPLNKKSFVLIQDNRLLANMKEINQNEHNQVTEESNWHVVSVCPCLWKWIYIPFP